MYSKIKELAEHALNLQNKDVMDSTLREIVGICDPKYLCEQSLDVAVERIGELAKNSGDVLTITPTAFYPKAGEQLQAGDAVVLDKGVAKKAKGGKK